MIALVDVNSFYASCEQVFRPDLIGKPVVVLSNNDGCIIAANREAKNLNLPMWKPAFEHAAVLKKYEVTVFSSNYALYGDMSARVMNALRTFAPRTEVYSIDEAFLDLSGIRGDLSLYADDIQQTVLKWTGLPVCVGVARTKSLAKLANKIAKKGPGGWVIDSEEDRIQALHDTEIGDVWGIGRRHAKRLRGMGVHTAFEFVELEDDWVKKHLTVVGLKLKHELQGLPRLELEEVPPPKKAIGTAKSFGKNLTDYTLINEALAYYTAECAVKLRKQDSLASNMTLFLETNPFRRDHAQYFPKISLNLAVPSDSTLELTRYAGIGLKKIFREGYQYKKVGILITGLVHKTAFQQSLFTPPKEHAGLMQACDELNRKFGKSAVRTASSGFRRSEWKLKQEQLSPRYTTCFSEILEVGG